MRKELSLFILLCAILSCNGLLEKLLDPLNLSGTILKKISFANKHSESESPTNGEYSTVYRGSSSASYSYSESTGGLVNGNGIPPQTYGQVNNFRQPVQGYDYGGQGNGYGNPPTEGSHGNYQQTNGFAEGQSNVPQIGNPSLTFNINVGGLFGLGHSKHSQHHGYKHHHGHGHGHGHGNDDFNFGNMANRNINGQNFNQNGGYETTYVTHQPEVINYNSGENKYPSELYNDNTQHYPVQNDRNGSPDEENIQSEDKYVTSVPIVNKPTEIIYVSTTESTKTPYENEKNSKVTTSNRKTTIKPDNGQPLLVPLNPNEYTYEGDKIHVASPKRSAEENTKKQEINKKEEEDFDIDVRFNDDE